MPEDGLKLEYTRRDALQGLAVYGAGDTAAMLILGEFSLRRLLGVMLVGATLYALEIPNYFKWIDNRVTTTHPVKRAALRTALAMLYFNPLWIARHLAFLLIAEGSPDAVNRDLLGIGLQSWLAGIPATLVANFIVQVKLPLKWRFFGSALFSALMAIYYALSKVIFNG